MDRKVSIVVPLYKSEAYMPKLLESLISQTYRNLEIILVDDGSPDDSGKLADEYAENDERIIVIHQKNGGTCAARNAGLEKASGDYLMFADGDDWLESDCVEYLLGILENNKCKMAMTDAIFTTRDRAQNSSDNIRIWTQYQAVAGIINTFIIPVGPWNKLYSMDVIKNNNISFSVPWFGEGLYFSVMAAQYSEKIAVGHRKIYNYRMNNPNSGCTTREVQNGINSLNNILYIKDSLVVSSKEIDEALNWHIWTNNYNLFVFIVGAGKPKQYNAEFKSAKKNMKKYCPSAMKNRALSVKKRILILVKTLFPTLFSKRSLRIMNKDFLKDTME